MRGFRVNLVDFLGALERHGKEEARVWWGSHIGQLRYPQLAEDVFVLFESDVCKVL